MHVGVCRIEFILPENQSLKGKRQVLRSVKDRVSHRFNVSIAEVEQNGNWQRAVLGVSCVSNDPRHANEVLSQVVAYIERASGDMQMLDFSIEVLHGY
jgi:uncharacterized protein YlxP (DUF503 family)